MGRGTSASKGGFRNNGRRRPSGEAAENNQTEESKPSYPQLTGDNSIEDIAKFIEANTSYKTDKSLKKIAPEAAQAVANRIVEMENLYGSLKPDGKEPVVRFNGRLKVTAAWVYSRDNKGLPEGTIELGSDFKTAGGVISTANIMAKAKQELPNGQSISVWNISPSASRDSKITYVITHELSHSLQRKIYNKTGQNSGKSYSQWQEHVHDMIMNIAVNKYGLPRGKFINSAYAMSVSRKDGHYGEFFAEALAGYHSGQRDPISLAAKEWTDSRMKMMGV